MGGRGKGGRLDGIDAARGFAIALMVLSHTVKSLLSFKQMPEWGIVPVHLVTKFSSTLFIVVFGVSVAIIYLPKVGTEAWPKARMKLLWRAVLVMFWYKVLSVVQMFERSDRQVILDTLWFKRFPDFVEVLQFYGWFLLLLPLLLPWWRSMGMLGRFLLASIVGMLTHALRVSEFDFWGVWQLEAIFIEKEDVFCFGILTRGTMVMAGMMLADVLTWGEDRERQQRILAGLCIGLGACAAVWFYALEHESLAVTFQELARNWGKHPPNLPFLTFTYAGALTILGLCLLAPRPVLWLLKPFVLLGRESLFCFNLHILVIFLGYRHHLGLRRQVTYEEALWLTAALIAGAAVLAGVYGALKRLLRRAPTPKPAREDELPREPAREPTSKPIAPSYIMSDLDDAALDALEGRARHGDSPRGKKRRRQ